MAYLDWDHCKENIQPLTQGRKIDTLFEALKLTDYNKERDSRLKERER